MEETSTNGGLRKIFLLYGSVMAEQKEKVTYKICLIILKNKEATVYCMYMYV